VYILYSNGGGGGKAASFASHQICRAHKQNALADRSRTEPVDLYYILLLLLFIHITKRQCAYVCTGRNRSWATGATPTYRIPTHTRAQIYNIISQDKGRPDVAFILLLLRLLLTF